jgi:hypothetical protein
MDLQSIVGSRNRVKVLRALLRNDGQSGRQVASGAGIAPSASKTSLEELVGCGLVLQVQDRGRLVHHLNRSHYLLSPLEKLFTEEGRLPERLADDVRRHLRTLDPPAELLCVGIAETGAVTLATDPALYRDATPIAVLCRQLRLKYGLRLGDCVGNPTAVPTEEIVWSNGQGESGSEQRPSSVSQRALRFFGIADPRGETETSSK